MRFDVLTLFPEMIEQGLNTSIIGRAIQKGCISLGVTNIRDFTTEKHGKVDDYTYGGGAGMLMQAQPIYDAYRSLVAAYDETEPSPDTKGAEATSAVPRKPRVIYVTPQGQTFHQRMAEELAKESHVIFLCGHYEGVEERVLQEIVTDYISIGDYVLTGGELPAMVMIDAIARNVPGVLHNDDSAFTESFHDDLLEYPQYTRPEIWHDKPVPAILLSGDHAKVDAWRLEQSIERTRERRPDLYEKYMAAHPPVEEKKRGRKAHKSESDDVS